LPTQACELVIVTGLANILLDIVAPTGTDATPGFNVLSKYTDPASPPPNPAFIGPIEFITDDCTALLLVIV
jgi:hypothetical protein